MSDPTTAISELEAAADRHGIDSALDALADRLTSESRFHELFDLRLLQARRRLGLPVLTSGALDDLDERLRTPMEESYVAACREVGYGLLTAARPREAWMYLRPVAERAEVAAELAKLKGDAEQIEALIEITLHEGVAPALGFELVLEHYGTFNAITMYESAMHQRPIDDRRKVAALLVRRLHDELMANVRADIEHREAKSPAETTLTTLVEHRPELFEGDNYHVDTTHLASVVRIGLVIDDRETVELLADMCAYGRRLSQHYQFPGEEPFREAYPAYGLFYGALLGRDVDQAVEYFRSRAEQATAEGNTAPAEVLVALLARVGRYAEAIDETARLMPPGSRRGGFAPSLVELAHRGGLYDRLMEIARLHSDPISFAVGLVGARQASGVAQDLSCRNVTPAT